MEQHVQRQRGTEGAACMARDQKGGQWAGHMGCMAGEKRMEQKAWTRREGRRVVEGYPGLFPFIMDLFSLVPSV